MLKVFLVLITAFLFVNSAGAASYRFLEDEAEPQFTLTFKATTAASGSMSVVFDWRDERNFYALDFTPQTVQFRSVIGGVSHRLQSVSWRRVNQSQVVIKRRGWMMQAIIDRRVALTAYDANLSSGKIGIAASTGWKWDTPRVQPVEALYFADDFTREAGKKGEWETVSGSWKLTATTEAIGERNIAMSANPFAFLVDASNGSALARSGRWFWDDYEARVAIRPQMAGTIGLAVYVQDASNYLALLWSSTAGPESLRLVRVVDGQSSTLVAKNSAFLPRQWYQLSVRTSPGFIEALVDGEPVLRARNDWFGQGGIGLIAVNCSVVNFDDVRVRSHALYRQDFNGPTGGAWTPAGGFWQARQGVLASAAARGDGGRTRFLLAGREDWSGYEMTASGRVGPTGSCGLVAGYHDDKNYTVFRWAGPRSPLPFKGRQQLLRYQNGKAVVVSDLPLTLKHNAEDGFARLRLRLSDGALTVYEGKVVIAQTADVTLRNGKPGLWSQSNATVGFRDVVMFFPPEPEPPHVAPKMEADALMVGWASPSGEWQLRKTPAGVELWNISDFLGDASLQYLLPAGFVGKQRVEFAFKAPREQYVFDGGYVLRVEAKEGTANLNISLLRGSETLQQATIDKSKLKSGKPIALRVDMEGGALLCACEGIPVLSYVAPSNITRPAGAALAIRATGFEINAQDLIAHSAVRDDYTFSEAPVDWYAPQGNWSVVSRWPCYSDWSFFGGTGLNPVLWSKRTYSGDTVVEMYAHNQMDLPKELGYSHPGDLNITLGGDGKNPSSGYSFVVAGWDNTRSRILKGMTSVAENTTEAAYFPYPINHNYTFHKRWYHIRAEARQAQQEGKPGLALTLTVDDTVLCRYFDPSPLQAIQSGGRVALWTVDSTIMVARARIESSIPGQRELPNGLLDASANSTVTGSSGSDTWVPQPVLEDGTASAIVDGDGEGWRIRNPVSGGLFAVKLQGTGGSTTYRVTPKTVLSFDLDFPDNVRLDLYAKIGDETRLIAINGNDTTDARAPLLGNCNLDTATAVAAGSNGSTNNRRWRRCTFALGAALHTLAPGAKSWSLNELNLGALHGDTYRWLGFKANPLGATYHLRNFQVKD